MQTKIFSRAWNSAYNSPGGASKIANSAIALSSKNDLNTVLYVYHYLVVVAAAAFSICIVCFPRNQPPKKMRGPQFSCRLSSASRSLDSGATNGAGNSQALMAGPSDNVQVVGGGPDPLPLRFQRGHHTPASPLLTGVSRCVQVVGPNSLRGVGTPPTPSWPVISAWKQPTVQAIGRR